MSRFKNKLNRLFKPPSESNVDAFPPRDLARAPIEVSLESDAAPAAESKASEPVQDARGTSSADRPLRRVRVEEEPAPRIAPISPQRAAAREVLSARLSRQSKVQRNNDAVAPEGKRERGVAAEVQESQADEARNRRTRSLLARSFEAWRSERRGDEKQAHASPAPLAPDARPTPEFPEDTSSTLVSPVKDRHYTPPTWHEDTRLREARRTSSERPALRTHTLLPDEPAVVLEIADTREEETPQEPAPLKRSTSEKKPGADDTAHPQKSAARTLAHTLVNRSRMSADAAAAMLNDALRGLLADTDRRRALRELASVEEERGHIELCLLAWRELAQLSRHDPQPHLELARLLEAYDGDRAQALAHVRESLKLAPWNDAAHRMARRLQRELGDDDSSLH